MNPTVQSGMHPDANTLAAFAEQLLPADECEQILAHMAMCSRCREVAFLAQQAASDEPTMAPIIARTSVGRRRSWWLGGWRWAWIPAGAFAVLIGIAVVMHFRGAETETQMEHNTASNEPSQQQLKIPAPPPLPTARPAAPTARDSEQSQTRAETESATPKAKDAREEEKGALARKQVAGGGLAPIASAPSLAAGSVHGGMTARAQASPLGGPMANQMQQNAPQQQQNLDRQNTVQQNVLLAAPKASQPSADKQTGANTAPGSMTETVTADALTVKEPKLTPPAPAPTAQLSYVPLKGKNLAGSSAATAELKKSSNLKLPDGAQALSVASAAGRTIAIDTAGSLYLSEDHGGHWQPVATQWTGRAVLVRNLLEQTDQKLLQAKPSSGFELMNDQLQTWTSSDGKTWKAKPLSDK